MIIAGDSYSYETQYPSWIPQLDIDYINIARSGYSNYDILQQLRLHSPQRAIINLSHLYRPPLAVQTGVRYTRAEPLNVECANRIIKTWTDAFIWSPFPNYESFKGVHYIPLYEENEMILRDRDPQRLKEYTYCNHFTVKGNQQLAEIIRSSYLN